MNSVQELPLFPGCESLVDAQERQVCSTEKFVEYLREQLQDNSDEKGKVAIRLYIDVTGIVERFELHHKSNAILTEQVRLVLQKMQEANFCWVPGRKKGEAVTSTLEFMLNFGTTCQDPM